jgi:hypothetical protein
MTAADSGPTIELLPGRMKLASDLAEAVLLLARFVTEQPEESSPYANGGLLFNGSVDTSLFVHHGQPGFGPYKSTPDGAK